MLIGVSSANVHPTTVASSRECPSCNSRWWLMYETRLSLDENIRCNQLQRDAQKLEANGHRNNHENRPNSRAMDRYSVGKSDRRIDLGLARIKLVI
jgi:hypothetical protein